MNKFEKFALSMSMLLFELRSTDINTTMIFTDDQKQIPCDYVEDILDNVLHIDAMKEKIRTSVLQDVQANPKNYVLKHSGDESEYVYSTDVYDHAYIIDTYIKDQYVWDNPVMKTVIVCDTCGSDNVQSRAWIRPNQNNEFIDLMSEEIQDNYCDDCDENVSTSNIHINNSHKVIGFQVQCTTRKIKQSKFVYSLNEARRLLETECSKTDQWQLLAIWTNDIHNPVMMFDGDPRKH